MTKTTRRKRLEKLIRQVWESLESHLERSHTPNRVCQHCGNPDFHASCVREYSEMILELAQLMEDKREDK